MGLVKQVVSSLYKKNILRLTKVLLFAVYMNTRFQKESLRVSGWGQITIGSKVGYIFALHFFQCNYLAVVS